MAIISLNQDHVYALRSFLEGEGMGEMNRVNWPKGQWVRQEAFCVGGDDRPVEFSGKVKAFLDMKGYLDDQPLDLQLVDGQLRFNVTRPNCQASYVWYWLQEK